MRATPSCVARTRCFSCRSISHRAYLLANDASQQICALPPLAHSAALSRMLRAQGAWIACSKLRQSLAPGKCSLALGGRCILTSDNSRRVGVADRYPSEYRFSCRQQAQRAAAIAEIDERTPAHRSSPCTFQHLQ